MRCVLAGALVDGHLHKEPFGLGEVESLLGVRLARIFEGRPNPLKVISVLESSGGALRLWDRARHVFSEKQRVLDFKAVCMSETASSMIMRHIHPSIHLSVS